MGASHEDPIYWQIVIYCSETGAATRAKVWRREKKPGCVRRNVIRKEPHSSQQNSCAASAAYDSVDLDEMLNAASNSAWAGNPATKLDAVAANLAFWWAV